MTPAHMRELQAAGVDVFTGGNHTIERPALKPLLKEPAEPVLAPINQVDSTPNWGAKTIHTNFGPVLVVSVLGTTFPQLDEPLKNPLQAIDEVLVEKRKAHQACIVNFHGDFSSEKRVIGYYLDGRVSAVIGDHWHVPTADAMILPSGTAHVTDVGMCGTLHSSLGVTKEIVISRWRDGALMRNEIAEGTPYQFNAVLIAIDTQTGLAKKITPIQHILEKIG
jgi:metallophosphoesterase (TIGR00282 family)